MVVRSSYYSATATSYRYPDQTNSVEKKKVFLFSPLSLSLPLPLPLHQMVMGMGLEAMGAASLLGKSLSGASREALIPGHGRMRTSSGSSGEVRSRWGSVRAADSFGGGGKTVGGLRTSASDNTNYVVPLDSRSPFTGLIRPLSEILRDLNKRVPDNIISPTTNSIPWYHANRMLSFYAPGWCGEVRDVILSDNDSVTVVYRVTIRGSDGETHRESTGTVSPADGQFENKDAVAAAEEIAFCRACARFGFGLYLYHEDEVL